MRISSKFPRDILAQWKDEDLAEEGLVMLLLETMGHDRRSAAINPDTWDVWHMFVEHGCTLILVAREAFRPLTMAALKVQLEEFVRAYRAGEVVVPERKPLPSMDPHDMAMPKMLDTWLAQVAECEDHARIEWAQLRRRLARRYYVWQMDYFEESPEERVSLGVLQDEIHGYLAGYEQSLCDAGLRLPDSRNTIDRQAYGGI